MPKPHRQMEPPQKGAGCPPEETLIELAAGRLRGPRAEEVQAHAGACASCSMLLIGLSDTAAGALGVPLRDAPTEQSRSSKFVAEFRLMRPIGQGAMGEVFLARDTFLDRLVALKFLMAGENSTSARERFYVEARAVARLQHPNVVTLYRAGEEQGRRYLVSEFVRGRSLERWQKPLNEAQVLNIGLGLARGLAAAHQRGVLHRDIKPANVIVTPEGEVKILDFGLAKLMEVRLDAARGTAAPEGNLAALNASETEAELPISNLAITKSGSLLGTPLYMAPESWRGEAATPQTDVYSLGALLYELCSGHPPHRAGSAAALGFRVIGNDAPPLATVAPSVDAKLAAVIDRCLQRVPSQRFASGVEVQEVLERITARATSIPRRIAMVALSLFVVALAAVAGLALAHDRQTKKQAELSQQLGQQVAAMEWLLRSARQLPLHDLRHEKALVRQRMSQIQTELESYGALGRGLVHYALGRGHMALHEYAQALPHLQLAIQHGSGSAEVHYALGVVLGKHFEQAIHEARLAGGGDWAKKQIKDLEPRYLAPAISSLTRSRSMNIDASHYLEGLLAYYQRDYETALGHAADSLRETPWLYEASALMGDVHMERAGLARDSGRYEEAEQEFSHAVNSYEAAAAAGQSDGAMYEGLAEALVQQMEMAVRRGQSPEPWYLTAVAASDKLDVVEPQAIAGSLKKTWATLMTMGVMGSGSKRTDRVQQCLATAETMLAKQTGNPYASNAAADCYLNAAEISFLHGGDPEPPLRKALSLLEPIVRDHPHFLWGLNDLGNTEASLGEHLQLHGKPSAKEMFLRAIEHFSAAASIDATYEIAPQGILDILTRLIPGASSDEEIQKLLTQADEWFGKCRTINSRALHCFSNYFQIYTAAAERGVLAGQDPQPRLQRAMELLSETRKLGESQLDTEQYAALVHVLDASARVRRKQDPAPSLTELQADLARCFSLSPSDPQCRMHAARAEWIKSDWLASQQRPFFAPLDAALKNARAATQGSIVSPDAWQCLAETHLRMAQALRLPKERSSHVVEGIEAVEKIFSINPNHARGWATRGALQLLRTESESLPAAKRAAAQSAVDSLERSLRLDPMLKYNFASLREKVRMKMMANH